jgi:type IV pilus assembly protein PilB
MAKAKYQPKKKVGEVAVMLGFLSPEQLNHILAKKAITKQLFGQLCIEEGFIDHEMLAQIIAEQYAYRYVKLEKVKNPDLLSMFKLDFMTKYLLIPYQKYEDKLEIAMAEPALSFEAVDELELLTDLAVTIVIASEPRIKEQLKKVEASQKLLDTVSYDMRLSLVRETDKGEDVLTSETVSAEESPIIKLVDSTILDGIMKGASDIHIESSDNGVIIRYRLDGMLHQATDPIDIQYQSPVVSRIKVMAELDIAEKRIPQDGRFKLLVMDQYVDFRVSILPTIFGENVVIRILDRESLTSNKGDFQLEGMDLPKKELERIRRMIHAPYGMFLMTGPTGSGKTTTLYRALSEVNSKDIKLITIEDPVEYQLKGISQIQVNEKKGLTFAKGLRSILRHDPDKILVGEIRDSETAQIALQSALTGHLVFTTIHANSSFEVINRFIHMGIEPYNLMSALNCIVAQRLIRTLCDCKEERPFPEKLIIDSALDPNLLNDQVFYQIKGCESCRGTGYKGRKAIIELVELDDDISAMFIDKVPVSSLKKKAKEAGSIFLREAAILEVLSGVTTLEEANRVTFIEQKSNNQ